ncbi:MAG: polysaccharide deacetylase family protein [Labilithrix sp.]|nr:polysaccharide deacetylase family protein [Labilithrix sp.]
MPSIFRAFVLAGSVAAGSWVGLDRPDAESTRDLAQRGLSSGARYLATLSAPAVPETPAPATSALPPEGPIEFGPLPQHRDPESVPSHAGPWPTLNPEASIAKAWMVAEGPAYEPGDRRRLVTLTFDDGPFPETTPAVLRALARQKIRAAFFVVGRYLDGDDERAVQSRATLEKVAAAGHIIGNHTHDHAHLAAITHTQVLDQIDRGAASIERVTGKRPVFFRPPFGELDDFGQQAVRDRNLDLLLWSVEKQDMTREDSKEVFRELVAQIEYKEGGIVLLHDIRWTSVRVLRELLGWLEERKYDPKKPQRLGYEVVDLPTYLRAVAASPLPYESRDELERVREAAYRARHPNATAKGTRAKPGDS